MRALLDTNIIIHREGLSATNYSIGTLYYWLDKLHYDKLIHPYSIEELKKAHNDAQQDAYTARLTAYVQMRTVAEQSDEFKKKIAHLTTTLNDDIDNQLLYEVYCGRADILITEDRKMLRKAEVLGINEKVYSINSFVTKCTNENPALIEYKALSVKKELFGRINVKDPFFDSFRLDYEGFEDWFAKKCDEEAYVCRSDTNKILGFLYLKTEEETESYSDIMPPFSPQRRLKVGTFKVESTGFRLGERFIKIIFDNAIGRNVNEIYVTLFKHRPELTVLYSLLNRWGFFEYGTKSHGDDKEEIVMVKRLGCYNDELSIKQNYPVLKYSHSKYFLPIEPQYHTPLLPDSQLRNENEVDFMGELPQKYALQKVYISFTFKRNMRPGDFLLIYRKGVNDGRKAYESVVSTIGIIDETRSDFVSRDDFLKYCENRTVFSESELNRFWDQRRGHLLVIKFIYVKSLTRKVILKDLWESGIVSLGNGPRPFDQLSDKEFETVLSLSNTKLDLLR